MVGKDKGKQGNVTAYIRELNAVFVSGMNYVKKNIFSRLILKKFYLFIYQEIQRISGGAIAATSIAVKEKPLIAPHQIKLIDPYDG